VRVQVVFNSKAATSVELEFPPILLTADDEVIKSKILRNSSWDKIPAEAIWLTSALGAPKDVKVVAR
jgi:hypothetical protein